MFHPVSMVPGWHVGVGVGYAKLLRQRIGLSFANDLVGHKSGLLEMISTSCWESSGVGFCPSIVAFGPLPDGFWSNLAYTHGQIPNITREGGRVQKQMRFQSPTETQQEIVIEREVKNDLLQCVVNVDVFSLQVAQYNSLALIVPSNSTACSRIGGLGQGWVTGRRVSLFKHRWRGPYADDVPWPKRGAAWI